jgi:hypothetical protein
MRGFESLLPQRLKQIAQTIRGSARKNLGLNNGVFGKVKEIRLSSFLKDTLHAYPPAPAPAPSPQLTDHSEPFISPYHSPSYSPISPVTVKTPCFDCEVSSPSPSIVTEHSPVASPTSYTASHTAGVAPELSRRVAEVSHGFKLRQDDERSNELVSHLLAPSSPCKFIWHNKPFFPFSCLAIVGTDYMICLMLMTHYFHILLKSLFYIFVTASANPCCNGYLFLKQFTSISFSKQN